MAGFEALGDTMVASVSYVMFLAGSIGALGGISGAVVVCVIVACELTYHRALSNIFHVAVQSRHGD